MFGPQIEPETLCNLRPRVGCDQRFQLALGIVQQTGFGV
jgi:hypothetical protein